MARSALHRVCVSALALGVVLLSVWLEVSQAATTASSLNVTGADNTSSSASASTTTTPASSANNGGANQNVNGDDPTTTTTKPANGFFDDDNNKAMFIVLPAMILVYGGCASIYCIHKLCKSYRRYKRRKQKQQMLAQMEQERLTEEPQVVEVGHTNAAYTGNTSSASASCSSMDMDVTTPGQTQDSAPGKAEQAQPYKPFHKDGNRAFNVASPSGSSGSKDDIIRYKTKSYEEKEGYAVKNPGYHRQQETEDPAMGLIDMQLKEALAMIDSVVRKPMEFKSRPDLEPKENENAEPIKRRRRMKKKVFVPQ